MLQELQNFYCIIESYIDYGQNSPRNPLFLYRKYNFVDIPGHEKMFSISGDSHSKIINRTKKVSAVKMCSSIAFKMPVTLLIFVFFLCKKEVSKQNLTFSFEGSERYKDKWLKYHFHSCKKIYICYYIHVWVFGWKIIKKKIRSFVSNLMSFRL